MIQLPQELMTDVGWCFAFEVAKSREDMLWDMCFFAGFMDKRDPKSHLERALPFADVRVLYDVGRRPPEPRWWEIDDQDEYDDQLEEYESWRPREEQIRVVAGPLAVLTCVDIMWDLHVAIAAVLDECEGHFFDGLELVSAGGEGEPPTYRVVFAS